MAYMDLSLIKLLQNQQGCNFLCFTVHMLRREEISSFNTSVALTFLQTCCLGLIC